MQTGHRFDLSVADFDPTTDALIARLNLRRQISLFEAGSKMRISPSRKSEELHEAEQNDCEFELREHRRFLIMIDAQMTATAWPSGSRDSGRCTQCWVTRTS
jgi:hypothetical protein